MPGRHQRSLARAQAHVDGRVQVGARVARVGVRRQRQVGVEPHDGDVQVGRGELAWVLVGHEE